MLDPGEPMTNAFQNCRVGEGSFIFLRLLYVNCWIKQTNQSKHLIQLFLISLGTMITTMEKRTCKSTSKSFGKMELKEEYFGAKTFIIHAFSMIFYKNLWCAYISRFLHQYRLIF